MTGDVRAPASADRATHRTLSQYAVDSLSIRPLKSCFGCKHCGWFFANVGTHYIRNVKTAFYQLSTCQLLERILLCGVVDENESLKNKGCQIELNRV